MTVRVGPGAELQWRDFTSLVCAVDNVPTRQFLESVRTAVPVANGGVGGTADTAGQLLWTRHRRGDPSLHRWYPVANQDEQHTGTGATDVPKELRDSAECSRLAYANVSLAAPFLGVAVGAILAAQVALEAAGVDQPVNRFKSDLLKLQGAFAARQVQGETLS